MTQFEQAIIFIGLLTAVAFGGHVMNVWMETQGKKRRHEGD